MVKWNAIETKLTEDKNRSRKTVVICIAAGILLTCVLFFGGMWLVNPIIEEYINENKEYRYLYDFYDKKVGVNQTAVYFIGSSIVGSSILPLEINQLLNTQGYNVTAYNLAVNGDTPVKRSIQIQKIIDSKPSLVIFGITYRSIADEEELPDEQVVLVHDRLDVRDDAMYLYSANELKSLQTEDSPIYRKKFLLNALSNLDYETKKTFDYSTDPYGDIFRLHCDKQKNQAAMIEELKNPRDPWRPVVGNETTRYKQALLYNVQTLRDAGIHVAIINMPLNPFTSEKITNESRQNYYDLLNEAGVNWYEMEYGYGDEYFFDSHHMTFAGATEFAPRIANVIIQEVDAHDIIHE